jgi:hypothetical protein
MRTSKHSNAAQASSCCDERASSKRDITKKFHTPLRTALLAALLPMSRMRRRGGKRVVKGKCARLVIIAMMTASPLSLVVTAAPAEAQQRAYDIDAQPLAKAVLDYSRQSGVFVLAPMDLVKNKRSQKVKGRYSAEDALTRLLPGAGQGGHAGKRPRRGALRRP